MERSARRGMIFVLFHELDEPIARKPGQISKRSQQVLVAYQFGDGPVIVDSQKQMQFASIDDDFLPGVVLFIELNAPRDGAQRRKRCSRSEPLLFEQCQPRLELACA
jgi:hypothetical protein